MNAMSSETVLITGASSGIGLELAKCFAADGSRLVLVARNTVALEALANKLRRARGVEVIVVTADLSLPETPRRIFQELSDRKVSVDVLVNNAGFGAIGAFDQLPLERQLEILRVNISALTDLTGRFLSGMIQRRRGGVLNVGSVAGFVPGPGMTIYYATKAFVLSFTEGLAGELAETDVTVTVLCPGPTATNFGNVAGAQNARLFRQPGMSAKAVAEYGHRAFRKGRVIAISGLQNQMLVLLARFAPRALVRRMARKFNSFEPKR